MNTGSSPGLYWAGSFVGGASRGLGQIEDGLAEMLRWETVHMQIAASRGSFFWGLADVYLAIGRSQEGLEAVDHTLEVISARSCEHDAELRRLKGELLLMGDGGAVAEAARCFRDAIELARRQRAKAWELRATMSLARLLAKQGCRDEACTMLAEIYGWFTEGFDTADLKDAKALLDELNG
jgi:tetratricopeptide (TPR) repeat protein